MDIAGGLLIVATFASIALSYTSPIVSRATPLLLR
jgi:hypothetical protein